MAWEENQKNSTTPTTFEDLLNKNDKKRILFVLPESAGDVLLCTALFKSIRKRYPKPEWAFYFACKPEYKDIINGNQYVDKVLDYHPMMDNLIFSEGSKDHKGFFDIAYLPYLGSQKMLNYMHNGTDLMDIINK